MMGSIRNRLRWNERSDLFQSVFLLTIVLGSTLGGYGLLTVAMGTPTPLVVVTGRSMETTYYEGDLLLIQSKPQEEIHIDDIIVFEDTTIHPTPIVHRVIDIEVVNGTYYFTTQGDNNLRKDDYTRTIDEIIGVVVGGIPWVGNISLVLRDYWHIVIPAMVFLLLVVPEIWERYIRPPADDK
jgi:signal peptidase I